MTKQELLEMIERFPDDITFLVSDDDEGNGYRVAHLDYTPELAVQYGPREWEILHPDDIAAGEYDEVDLAKAVKVAVFW